MKVYAPPTGKARLTLTINDTDYLLRRIIPHPAVALRAWRLRKTIGTRSEFYDVHEDAHGVHCTCADFHWRRENVGQACKHVLALMAVGLLGEES